MKKIAYPSVLYLLPVPVTILLCLTTDLLLLIAIGGGDLWGLQAAIADAPEKGPQNTFSLQPIEGTITLDKLNNQKSNFFIPSSHRFVCQSQCI